MAKVIIIMGSKSDLKWCEKIADKFSGTFLEFP